YVLLGLPSEAAVLIHADVDSRGIPGAAAVRVGRHPDQILSGRLGIRSLGPELVDPALEQAAGQERKKLRHGHRPTVIGDLSRQLSRLELAARRIPDD